MDWETILVNAQCGEYSFVCCLSPEQLRMLLSLLGSATDQEVALFYKMACGCAAPSAQGGGGVTPRLPPPGGDRPFPQPGRTNQCITRFRGVLCTPTVINGLKSLETVLKGLLIVPGVSTDDPQLQKFKDAVSAVIFGCTTNNAMIQEGVINEFCAQISTYRKRLDALPEIMKSLLKPALTVGLPNELQLVISECCP